jgi:glycosyltransferase involved in cell wall biosynthesis
LNEIAAHARGRYVARLDGDDLLHPDRLARQVAFLDAHSGVDLVGTATYCIDSAEALVGIRRAKEATAGAGHVLRHVVVVHATAMGRTEWFRRNPYDGAYVNAEDHELWCRTCSTSSFAQIDEPLYFYRELDSFRFEKYRTTCRTLRRMLWRYGPPAAGYGATASLIAGTLVRQSIYGLFSAAGAARMLINRRNRRVTAQERADAMRALRRIGDTPVPGLTTVRAAG